MLVLLVVVLMCCGPTTNCSRWVLTNTETVGLQLYRLLEAFTGQ